MFIVHTLYLQIKEIMQNPKYDTHQQICLGFKLLNLKLILANKLLEIKQLAYSFKYLLSLI